MYRYRCYARGGMCDAGELENGVCYDCRQEDGSTELAEEEGTQSAAQSKVCGAG